MPTLPTRRCDDCGDEDNHPRFVYVEQTGRELLFHNDCVPPYIAAEFPDHPGIAARADGARGDELRAVLVAGVEKGTI